MYPVGAAAQPISRRADTSEAAAPSVAARSQSESTEFRFSPSYRVRTVRVDPLDLSGERVRGVDWTEQRFRLDAKLARPKLGSITMQFDALDGVLFGDNGQFGQTPASNSGVSIATKRPNLVGWEVGLADDGDPLDPDSYIPVLSDQPLLELNYLYADILLPVGMLRIGRQPLNYGATVSAHDGGPHNRWGVSEYSDAVDRILFGTKLDEAWRIMSGGKGEPDLSQDNGVIWAVFYDLLKQHTTPVLAGGLRQIGTALQFRKAHADWQGWDWEGLGFSTNAVYLSDDRFGTKAFGFPVLVQGELEDFHLTLQYIHLRGDTREISEGFAALTGNEARSQKIRSHGAHAVLDYEIGPVMLTMQFDYATGDSDPRSSTPITSFSFARDLNIGLLLFERVLAFESARSVAVGIENLASADLDSFPLTEARTDGRFTNAIAVFPQVKVDWFESGQHRLHTRAGALFAWPEADGGVVDPIMTSLRADGERIDDDAINFHGGDPGDYYGTELDLQLGYSFSDFFEWTVEGAVLLPGSSLRDEHGNAVTNYLVENRFVVSM